MAMEHAHSDRSQHRGTSVSTLARDPKVAVSVMRVVAGQLTSQPQLSVGMDVGEIQVEYMQLDLYRVSDNNITSMLANINASIDVPLFCVQYLMCFSC